MRKVNYKSDFDFLLRLTDCRGQEVPAPDCDWSVRIYTGGSRVNAYEAWRRGDEWHNAFDDGGRIHIVVNRPRIGVGTLQAEFHVGLPNVIYDDGVQDLYKPQTLDIELVDGPGDCPGTAEVELVLPYVKGDPGEPFTYDDFTDEQKAELIAPIREDIKRAIEDKQDKISVSDDFELPDDARLSLTDRAKQRLFDDMWNATVGPYGTVDHTHVEDDGVERHYFLNELWLKYTEAVRILQYISDKWTGNKSYRTYPERTLSITYNNEEQVSLNNLLYTASALETLRFNIIGAGTQTVPVTTVSGAFRWCRSLRSVYGVIQIVPNAGGNIFNWTFAGCSNLRDIQLKGLKMNVSFEWSPYLSLDSLIYMVANRYGTTAFTITVHPDVYAKLTDETNEEWHKVLTDALAKDISFATV